MPRKRPTNRNTHRKLRVERLEDRAMLAGDLELVRDINTAPAASGSDPSSFVEVGGTLYFSANNGGTGIELWKSNGTEAGTLLVEDIRPGFFGAGPRSLTNVGGTLYFVANDGLSGFELWKSDGAEGGTVRVKDIVPGSYGTYPSKLTNVGGRSTSPPSTA